MNKKQIIVNLYNDAEIFNIRHTVSIGSEEDLNSFWDYISIVNHDMHELINTFITQLYNFSLSYIIDKSGKYFEITLEESPLYFYFTIKNKKTAKAFLRYLEQRGVSCIFEKNMLSVKLKKSKYEKKIQKIQNTDKKRERNLIRSVKKPKKAKMFQPYGFITHDDLQELLHLSEDMQELIYKAKVDGLHLNLFRALRSKFSLFCLTLNCYDEVANISYVITNFSRLLNQHADRFIEFSKIEIELITGFIYNIDTWLQTLFVKGGAHIYFMDNSIKADYEMIVRNIIPPVYEYDNGSLEDIFDF